VKAHRLAYERHSGAKLNPEIVIMHSCDNPPCVNPAHLKAGTIRENNLDRILKGRLWHVQGEANSQARLTRDDVISIRSLVECGASRGEVALKHGVSRSLVSMICSRRRWKHVP
jgi:hypothetical protein